MTIPIRWQVVRFAVLVQHLDPARALKALRLSLLWEWQHCLWWLQHPEQRHISRMKASHLHPRRIRDVYRSLGPARPCSPTAPPAPAPAPASSQRLTDDDLRRMYPHCPEQVEQAIALRRRWWMKLQQERRGV